MADAAFTELRGHLPLPPNANAGGRDVAFLTHQVDDTRVAIQVGDRALGKCAILAGDALLASANSCVARYDDPALCRCFSQATSRTAAGEILEIASQRHVDVSGETYADIIRGKTAWLIRASCEMGALRAGGNVMQVAAAAEYGENLGMAFQLVDDALDFADSGETGKPTAGDVREGKLTPPLRLYRHEEAPGVFILEMRHEDTLVSAARATWE